MIRTLRITSVLTAVAAVVLLVFQVALGAPAAKEPEFTSVVEKFKKDKSTKTATKDKDVSPLVKQAQSFALYLDPPKPKPRPAKTTRKATPKGARPKAAVKAKFKLIGTSYYAAHPELSLALIDEPGKGYRWVRQSSSVGHLVIHEVKNGSIIVKDGSETSELIAERPAKRSLIKGQSSKQATTGSSTITPSRAVAEDGKPLDPEQLKKQREEGEKMMAEFEQMIGSMQMSTTETKKLDRLGKKLKNQSRDPNAVRNPKNAKAERLSKIKAARNLRRTRKNKDRKNTDRNAPPSL
ncbi:hypothetical protein ACFL3G_04630 [Planctomycetota bacterium]